MGMKSDPSKALDFSSISLSHYSFEELAVLERKFPHWVKNATKKVTLLTGNRFL